MKKKAICMLLILAAALSLLCCASALIEQSGTCGEHVTWHRKNMLLTISGTGEMYDFYSLSDIPWYDSRSGIEAVVVESGVTHIGYNAFYNLMDLTDVTLPESLTGIGGNAFRQCVSLSGLAIPGHVTGVGNYAFRDCSALTDIVFPVSVASIDQGAFYGCTALTSVTIRNQKAVLGDDLFRDCPAALTVHGWPGSTAETYAAAAGVPFESLGSLSGPCGESVTWAFDPAAGKLTISGKGAMEDNSLEYAPWHSYGYGEMITSAVIGKGVTRIGDGAFYQCFSLNSVTIPNSVTSIGNYAFNDCFRLTGITIPNSVTSIGDTAFSESGLTSITIPAGVTSIGNYVFEDCHSLSSVILSDGVTSIGTDAFSFCSNLTSITLPSSVSKIAMAAFYHSGLRSVTVKNPNCVFGEGEADVFEGCSDSLVLHGYAGSTAETYAAAKGFTFEALPVPAPTFFLPTGLKTVQHEAFAGISAVAVQIPGSVESIIGNPFADSAVFFIYGVPGTAAQTFANACEYTFVPVGD